MRQLSIRDLCLVAFFGLLLVSFGYGQGDPPVVEATTPQTDRPAGQQVDILRQLGLTKEQAQRIRRANMERKPLLEAAQAKFREANLALDEAIYADVLNEEEVKLRLKEAQIAQAELIRVRFTNELMIRRVLTPEQLTRFREMRQRFAAGRENMQTRQRMNMEKRRQRQQERPPQTTPRPAS